MMPKVAVLLAGYNGQQFIIQQIFSILNQVGVQVDIFIRIEGNSLVFRNTICMLASHYPSIHYIEGDITSTPASNFYSLILQDFKDSYDFYALCDQDDVWLPCKLFDSISLFNGDKPQGASSGVTAVYPNGKAVPMPLGQMRNYDYFFQSGGPGCTYVLNNSGFLFLRSFLNLNLELLSVKSHDWLIYFIFRYSKLIWHFGGINNIFYRQHSNNVAGLNRGVAAKIKRLKLLFSGWYIDDLKILLNFSKENNNHVSFINPLELRRTYVASFVIWFYFWGFLNWQL